MNIDELFNQRIAETGGWRAERLKELRTIIESADAELKMEWKWDTSVWAKNGLVCAISAFKDHVKINFFRGASLADPNEMFNSGLESKTNRSINFTEYDNVNEAAIKDLVKAAITANN